MNEPQAPTATSRSRRSMSDTPRTDADIFIASGGQRVATLQLTKQMETELAVARKGLEAVESLINESHGVCGLHLNGDFAPWSELRTGGRFEEWLIAFDDALNAARSSNDRKAHGRETAKENE